MPVIYPIKLQRLTVAPKVTETLRTQPETEPELLAVFNYGQKPLQVYDGEGTIAATNDFEVRIIDDTTIEVWSKEIRT